MSGQINKEQTRFVRERYNRISRLYNVLEWPMEIAFYRRWRRKLFARLQGRRVLEIGIGTGKNLPFYRGRTLKAVGLDFSEGMLYHALPRARELGILLVQGDAQLLPFKDHQFDTVLATFVFCSVPDPVLGLSEIRRVLKPEGRLLLLEHVLPENRFLAEWFNRLNAYTVRRIGVNINRTTAQNIRRAGFDILEEHNLLSTIFKLFVAHPQ